MTTQASPYGGLRVIDMTSVVMGALATQMLGDFGADVVKIEPPEGDVARKVGASRSPGMGPLFLHLNRNKRSVVLDCKRPSGRDALLRLLADADVLAFNVRPDAMERLGLGWDAVRAVNPRLLYVSMVGFGQRGPSAREAAFDDLIQAATGLADLNGRGGSGPRYVPANLADRTVGLYAFGTIAAALALRERTGRGQAVSIPMFEVMATQILGDHLYGRTFDPPLGDMGYPRLLSRNRGPFATADGHLCCLVYTDEQWRTFLALVGKGALFAEDPRFGDMGARTRHIDHVYGLLADELRRRSTEHWMDAFRQAGLTAYRVVRLEDLPTDPQLVASGLLRRTEHPTEGPIDLLGLPSEWSEWAPSLRHPVPRLGEHTREVLAEAGFTSREIDLIESG